jgi:hypothetical protein
MVQKQSTKEEPALHPLLSSDKAVLLHPNVERSDKAVQSKRVVILLVRSQMIGLKFNAVLIRTALVSL